MHETRYAYFDGFKYPPDMPADGILSRTILDNASVRLVLFFFAAGQELSEHTAALPAIIHILSGEARLELGGDAKDASTGSIAYMTAGLRHAVFAQTPVVMLLQLIKCPRSTAEQQ
jgi:quercetin dioxygenase-like cupin family protein